MMIGFGQDTPDKPTVGSRKTRISRTRLKFEEVLEYGDAAAISLTFKHNSQLAPVAAEALMIADKVPSKNSAEHTRLMQLLGDLHTYLRTQVDLVFDEKDVNSNVLIFATPGKVPDLAKMVDASSDTMVVTTGAFVACGVRMVPLLELTDQNNLMKIANGRLDDTGKFRRADTHPAPDYHYALALQGYDPDADYHMQQAIHDADAENQTAKAQAARQAITDEVVSDVVRQAEAYVIAGEGPMYDAQQPVVTHFAQARETGRYSSENPPATQLSQQGEFDLRATIPVIRSVPGTQQRIYSGPLLDALVPMVQPGSCSSDRERAAKLLDLELATAIAAAHLPVIACSLRMTRPGDPGPRGVVFECG